MRWSFRRQTRTPKCGLFNARPARKDGTRSQFFPRAGLHLRAGRNSKWVTGSSFTGLEINQPMNHPVMEFELKEKSSYWVLVLAMPHCCQQSNLSDFISHESRLPCFRPVQTHHLRAPFRHTFEHRSEGTPRQHTHSCFRLS